MGFLTWLYNFCEIDYLKYRLKQLRNWKKEDAGIKMSQI